MSNQIPRFLFLKKHNLYVLLSLCLLLIVLVPYLVLACFSVPAADDFQQAAFALNAGVFGFVKSRYVNWNGRYSADFVLATYNVVGNYFFKNFLINFYYTIPWLIIGCYVLSNSLFWKMLTGDKSRKIALIYGTITPLAIITNTELRSTVFWLAGGISYGLANAVLILLFALNIYTIYGHNQNKLLIGLNLLMIGFINGLSETTMVSYVSLILTLLILNLLLKTVARKALLINLFYALTAIISGLIVYLAPGNKVRESQVENTKQLLPSLTHSFSSSVDNIFHWLGSYGWIILVLIILVLVLKIDFKNSLIFSSWKIFIAIITSLLVSFYMSYFTRWYAYNSIGPLRSNSVSYTLFLLATIFSGFAIAMRIKASGKFLTNWKKLDSIFLSLVTAFCVFTLFQNSSLLTYDFSFLEKHRDYYQKYYSLMSNAPSGSDLIVPAEPQMKIVRYGNNLTSDQENWINQGYSAYFGLKSVICQGKDCPSQPNGD